MGRGARALFTLKLELGTVDVVKAAGELDGGRPAKRITMRQLAQLCLQVEEEDVIFITLGFNGKLFCPNQKARQKINELCSNGWMYGAVECGSSCIASNTTRAHAMMEKSSSTKSFLSLHLKC